MATNATLIRDASNCKINQPANYNDLPIAVEPHFYDNFTRMCGFNYPNALPPATNLTACCDSDVQVYNGCFHYCETWLQWGMFGACVTVQLNSTGQLKSTEQAHVDCNIYPDGRFGIDNPPVGGPENKVKNSAVKQPGSRAGLASWLALSVVIAAITSGF